MEKKIKDVMQKEAVEIDETTASDLQTIMAEEKKQVDSLFPSGSYFGSSNGKQLPRKINEG